MRLETTCGSLVGENGHGHPPGQGPKKIEMIAALEYKAPLASLMLARIWCSPGPRKSGGRSTHAKSVQNFSRSVYSTPSIHSSRLEGRRSSKSKRRKFTVTRS